MSLGIQGIPSYDPPKYPNLSHCELHWSITKQTLINYLIPVETFLEHTSEPVDEGIWDGIYFYVVQ